MSFAYDNPIQFEMLIRMIPDTQDRIDRIFEDIVSLCFELDQAQGAFYDYEFRSYIHSQMRTDESLPSHFFIGLQNYYDGKVEFVEGFEPRKVRNTVKHYLRLLEANGYRVTFPRGLETLPAGEVFHEHREVFLAAMNLSLTADGIAPHPRTIKMYDWGYVDKGKLHWTNTSIVRLAELLLAAYKGSEPDYVLVRDLMKGSQRFVFAIAGMDEDACYKKLQAAYNRVKNGKGKPPHKRITIDNDIFSENFRELVLRKA